MSAWQIENIDGNNPFSSNLPQVGPGEYNAKIDSIKTEDKDGNPLFTKAGEPKTNITLKIIDGESEGGYLTESIYPESSREDLVRMTKSKLFDIGKSAGVAQIMGPDSILGQVVKVKVSLRKGKDGKDYNRIEFLPPHSSTATPQVAARPSLLGSASNDTIPFEN